MIDARSPGPLQRMDPPDHPGTPLRRASWPWALALLAGMCPLAAVSADQGGAPGLRAMPGSAWSTRFELGENPALADPLFSPVTARLSWQWLSDYRFAPAWGLRATGGVRGQLGPATTWSSTHGSSQGSASLVRHPPRGASTSLADPGSSAPTTISPWATPYLGLGYDTSTGFRNGWGGWGLSADLGLVTRRNSSLRLGSDNGAGEDGWRTWRLTPVVQVGVSYSF
jgi:hypothetical protein